MQSAYNYRIWTGSNYYVCRLHVSKENKQRFDLPGEVLILQILMCLHFHKPHARFISVIVYLHWYSGLPRLIRLVVFVAFDAMD